MGTYCGHSNAILFFEAIFSVLWIYEYVMLLALSKYYIFLKYENTGLLVHALGLRVGRYCEIWTR